MSINWNIQDFPFLPAVVPQGALGVQSGNALNVPTDGSVAVPVVFATPYGGVPVVVEGPNSGSVSSGLQLYVEFTNITENGFDVTCTGGPSGRTITVGWIAYLGS